MLRSIAIALALAAGGCSTQTAVVLTCPPLPTYSDAQMQRAADEYEQLDGAGIIRVMIDDYGEVRARCRAMEKRA